jgi:hypothetical protein
MCTTFRLSLEHCSSATDIADAVDVRTAMRSALISLLPNRVSKVVEPKRKKLAEAEGQLEAANKQLKDKQDALSAVVQRVDNLKQQLADAESEQRQLSAQVRDAASSVTSITWSAALLLWWAVSRVGAPQSLNCIPLGSFCNMDAVVGLSIAASHAAVIYAHADVFPCRLS